MLNLKLQTKEEIITIPSSKSITHRALILASFSKNEFHLENVTFSNDIISTINCLRNLGKDIETRENEVIIYPSEFKKINDLNVLESGSTLRFMIPLSLMLNTKIKIDGINHLKNRPIDDFFPLFDQLGVKYEYDGALPITIDGKLKSGDFQINGNVTSQFITGLLLTLPFVDGDSTVTVINEFESKSYVDLTVKVLNSFGVDIKEEGNKYFIKGKQEVKIDNYKVEPDFSQAAFFLVLNTFGKSVIIKDLKRESLQGDKKIIDILEDSNVLFDDKFRVLNNEFSPQEVDLSDNPDLAPILALFFSTVNGPSRLYNLNRLQYKECDRLQATYLLLKASGVDIKISDDSLIINGPTKFNDCVIDDFNDHRILMTAAIMSNYCNVSVKNLNSVKKSFPNFFEIYKQIGGEICE